MSNLCDGVSDVYTNTVRRARKEHYCCACCETIPSGHRYHVVTVIFDRQASSYKRCVRCEKIHQHLVDIRDAYDDTWPDEELNCGHDYEEIHGRPPPDEIAALSFAVPEEMQQ